MKKYYKLNLVIFSIISATMVNSVAITGQAFESPKALLDTEVTSPEAPTQEGSSRDEATDEAGKKYALSQDQLCLEGTGGDTGRRYIPGDAGKIEIACIGTSADGPLELREVASESVQNKTKEVPLPFHPTNLVCKEYDDDLDKQHKKYCIITLIEQNKTKTGLILSKSVQTCVYNPVIKKNVSCEGFKPKIRPTHLDCYRFYDKTDKQHKEQCLYTIRDETTHKWTKFSRTCLIDVKTEKVQCDVFKRVNLVS